MSRTSGFCYFPHRNQKTSYPFALFKKVACISRTSGFLGVKTGKIPFG